MVRTQVQLTEEQMAALKEMAVREKVSMAELVRRAVDTLLATRRAVGWEERRRRALEVVGRFDSGLTDVSERHDDYLAEGLYEELERKRP